MSPTLGAIGSFGATGLDDPSIWPKEKIDGNCTVNPFIYPVFEKDPENKLRLKWCPGNKPIKF